MLHKSLCFRRNFRNIVSKQFVCCVFPQMWPTVQRNLSTTQCQNIQNDKSLTKFWQLLFLTFTSNCWQRFDETYRQQNAIKTKYPQGLEKPLVNFLSITFPKMLAKVWRNFSTTNWWKWQIDESLTKFFVNFLSLTSLPCCLQFALYTAKWQQIFTC